MFDVTDASKYLAQSGYVNGSILASLGGTHFHGEVIPHAWSQSCQRSVTGLGRCSIFTEVIPLSHLALPNAHLENARGCRPHLIPRVPVRSSV